jgi:lipopolysaccharide/colanic/teichoic acid biosynthesis glycosyltransferase
MSAEARDGITVDGEDGAGARSAESRYAATIKPCLDFVVALALFVVAAPIIQIILILVRLTSKGSPIYTQKRLGLGGRTITIYKIRTMYQDSERDTGPVWSLPGDPRITPIGWFLRWAHLDELPQLVNVLRGELSLIGPRPERPEIVPKLEHEVPGYRQRLSVRPGLTGLAQVQQPPDTDLDSVRRKLDFDLYYVERLSLWLDLRIFLATVFYLVRVPGVMIAWMFRFPGESLHTRVKAAGSAPYLAADSRSQAYFARLLSHKDSLEHPVFEWFGRLGIPRERPIPAGDRLPAATGLDRLVRLVVDARGARARARPPPAHNPYHLARGVEDLAAIPLLCEIVVDGGLKQPVVARHVSSAASPAPVKLPVESLTDFNRARPPPERKGTVA